MEMRFSSEDIVKAATGPAFQERLTALFVRIPGDEDFEICQENPEEALQRAEDVLAEYEARQQEIRKSRAVDTAPDTFEAAVQLCSPAKRPKRKPHASKLGYLSCLEQWQPSP
jgi:hypothetical protein